MKEIDALLFLSYLNFDYKIKENILNHFTLENLDEILKIDEKYLKESKLLTKKNLEKLLEMRKKFDADTYIEYLEKKKIKFVTILDEDYPKNLQDIEYKPQVLYFRGTLLPEDEFSLSIVGSRKHSSYGLWATENFAREISNFNITITSGMALGIDSIAHKTAIKNKKRTLAVLGCSVDEIYPRTNYRLYNEIIQNGAVISEFPVGTKPFSYNFPVRNRIISGLSKALLVIEAQERSGTLISARFANEQSKEIFAIPGNLNSIYSKGTNSLIKDGALIATSYEDIISGVVEFSNFIKDTKKEKKNTDTLSPTEILIYTLIEQSPKSANKISEDTGLSIVETNTILTALEMKSFIKELNGGIFSVE
ncbi:MAG: DNA-processing protein DprA [Peptoniphilaceae bacterium]|uniref:DNA-processing protein DprA n=1 Tax=Parvimonas sp. TaxID=1944660 RepID=UPI0025D411C8|nr:DNA-processing protein DprA [Parvimonas sp.]MCI5997949.1 DNA-processing protein DprA [Parvimonas sp.]MDD7764208.1 DNA-processing protein DprA [Peptoniphilaceae bacterium]MDY3050413.1 DNA-processing protein DprA [Parvimonas sp.]